MERTTGSPHGTTFVIQLLEVCNTNSETQDTQYQPIVFRSLNLFYTEMVHLQIWVPLSKLYLEQGHLQLDVELKERNY